VDFGNAIWCPSCVAAGAGKAKAAKAETSRTLYDSMVLILPLGALLLWPFTAVAAPAALVLGLVKMREPLSIVRTSRWRLWLGMTIAVAEIAGWIWGILYLVARLSTPGARG
jgi:hypothetical protein